MYKTVLITGGCGAIGSEVINFLKDKYPHTRFVNLDALTYAGKEENIEAPYENYKFYKGDICDAWMVSYVLDVEKPECIINLAAETHVDNSFGNSFVFTRTNILGTHTILECVKDYIAKGGELTMFLHMSTDEVYGSVGDDEPARKETSLFAPSNPYAATKAGAEMLCHAYHKSFGIPVIITRCNNAISKYQHEEKLIPRTIQNLLQGKRMTIHGEGKAKRTFIHAYDIASALDVVMTRGEIGSIYNIGTRMEYSVIEVVKHILELIKPGERLEDWVEYIPDRAFQDYRYYIDMSELMKLGWKEEITFAEAVKEVIARYMASENV